jgi:hypothetical protein
VTDRVPHSANTAPPARNTAATDIWSWRAFRWATLLATADVARSAFMDLVPLDGYDSAFLRDVRAALDFPSMYSFSLPL